MAKLRLDESHGMCNTPEYNSWKAMKKRCYYPKTTSYNRYGGRGITVCDKWLHSFVSFYEDMGPRPLGTSLDRINNDGDYTPENCKWSTAREQANNGIGVIKLVFDGQELSVSQWARRIGVSKNVLHYRIRSGWSIERALTERLNLQGFQKDNIEHLKRQGASADQNKAVASEPSSGVSS